MVAGEQGDGSPKVENEAKDEVSQVPREVTIEVARSTESTVTMSSLKIDIPRMDSAPSYDHWKSMIKMWSKITTTDKKKQAVVVTLTLPVEGQKLAMQITDKLEQDDGLEVMLKKLDKLYELNKDQKIYAAYEAFKQFKRPQDMPLVKLIAAIEERSIS